MTSMDAMIVDWRHGKKCPSQDSDFIDKFDRHKDAQFFSQVETRDSSP